MVGLTLLAPFGGATGYLTVLLLQESAMMTPVARADVKYEYLQNQIRPKLGEGKIPTLVACSL